MQQRPARRRRIPTPTLALAMLVAVVAMAAILVSWHSMLGTGVALLVGPAIVVALPLGIRHTKARFAS